MSGHEHNYDENSLCCVRRNRAVMWVYIKLFVGFMFLVVPSISPSCGAKAVSTRCRVSELSLFPDYLLGLILPLIQLLLLEGPYRRYGRYRQGGEWIVSIPRGGGAIITPTT